jgi:hypothetical protein
MATDVVPARASRGSLVDPWWWLRLVVRTTLALLAFMLLGVGDDRFVDWSTSSNGQQQLDNSLWLAAVGLLVGTGFLFGLATWLPFTKLRYVPSRLALAFLALLPLAQFWWVFLRPQPEGPFGQFRWYDNFQLQYVFAVLAGVAIASGLRSGIHASGSRSREP